MGMSTEDVDRLGAMWSELLDCDHATEDSDFFECGGTSILAVHLAASIQEEFGVPVDAVEVVVERRFGRIAGLVGERRAAVS
jgi:acyl carrier protein